MPQVSHINWPEFPLLVARLKEIEVKLAQGVALPHLYSEAESRAILAGIRTSANGVNVAACRTVPLLDEFLDRIDAHFVSNFGIPGLSPDSVLLIQSVNQAFLSKPCVQCGAVRKCDRLSDLSNSRAVDEFGQCFRLLRDLFDFVVELCADFYAHYAKALPAARLALHTEPLGTRNPILDLAMAGQTREISDAERAVYISLLVPEFDLADYFACLYIMLHECFVHGWCGVALDTGESSWSDSFHEGWMDWVGFELLTQWFGASPAAKFDRIRAHAQEFLDAGVKARGRRLNYWAPLHRNAPCDAKAAAAARCLLRYFEVVLGDREQARTAFFRFSLELNSSTIDDRQRALLVANVHAHLSGKAAVRTFVSNAALTTAIDDFQRGGNMDVLVRVLNSL